MSNNKVKTSKRIVNWSKYNQALKKRGSLTLWISSDIEVDWYNKERTGEKGKPKVYSNTAIELVLTVGKIYNQRLRQATGLVESIFKMHGINLPVPDYTTLSRRGNIEVPIKVDPNKEDVHIIVDGTGLKMYGEGEWKVRKHGYTKHRMWKKLHIGIDENGEIRMVTLTNNNVTDADGYLKMEKQEKANIKSFRGDGGYDRMKIYENLKQRGDPEVIIPPQRNAKIASHGNRKGEKHKRDENLRQIRRSSRKSWKKKSGYHKRSIVESTMYRVKNTFTHKLNMRTEGNQLTEVRIMCKYLNEVMKLGMPEYET